MSHSKWSDIKKAKATPDTVLPVHVEDQPAMCQHPGCTEEARQMLVDPDTDSATDLCLKHLVLRLA